MRASRPSLGLVVPELPEGFLQQVGHVESLVGLEKLVQSPLSLQREVLAVREKGVALTLDEGPIPTRKAVVLASPHLVESIGEMSHDMELVVDDLHIRDVPLGRVVEGLPHVHRRQFDVAGLGLANPLEEEIEVCLPAAVATHPDRAAAIQVADHDAVVVPLADGDFVDADNTRCGDPGLRDLRGHVDLVEFLDRAVVQPLQFTDVLVRHPTAQFTDAHRKALSVARVLRQPIETLYEHTTAPGTVDPPSLEFQVDSPPSGRHVPDSARTLVVATPAPMATA